MFWPILWYISLTSTELGYLNSHLMLRWLSPFKALYRYWMLCAGCFDIFIVLIQSTYQRCALLRFFGLTRLNTCYNPGYSTLTQLNTTFLDWLNSDSTEIRNLLNRLNSDWTRLIQIWVKSGLTHHIFPNLAKTCWPRGGRGVRSNVAVGSLFPCNARYLELQNINVFPSEK